MGRTNSETTFRDKQLKTLIIEGAFLGDMFPKSRLTPRVRWKKISECLEKKNFLVKPTFVVGHPNSEPRSNDIHWKVEIF